MKRRNNSFSYRLTRSCLALTLVPLILFLSMYATFMSRVLRTNLQKEHDNVTEQLALQVDDLYANMSFISLDLLSRTDFFNAIKQLYYNSRNDRSAVENYKSMVSAMINYGYFQKTFHVIYLDAKGHYYNTNFPTNAHMKRLMLSQSEMVGYNWTEMLRAAKGEPVLINMDDSSLSATEERTLTMGRSIQAPTNTVGYILVQLEIGEKAYLFDSLANAGALYGIFRSDGTLLYANDSFTAADTSSVWAGIAQGTRNYEIGGEIYTLSLKQGTSSDFCVVALFPQSIVWKEMWGELLPMVMISIFLILMVIIWILLFSYKFSRPLRQLTEMIRETTIDNLEEVHILDLRDASDEMQYLNRAYEKMRRRLNSMIEEKLELTALQAEQRYRFLQYQINPHFMYNTLNVIGIMGMESGNMKIHQSCQMLARLLRYSLQDYRKGTTFREETDNIHTYMELMKIRFEHKIRFLIQVDEELNDYQLPRFTMQPFVENIFEHAFDAAHKVVTLMIRAIVEQDRWRLTISDDGHGMSQQEICALCSSIDQSLSGNGQGAQNGAYGNIGVKNTITRLNMFYNGDFMYAIESAEASGCNITLSGILIEGENT